MSIPVPNLSNEAVKMIVCSSGPEVPCTIHVTDPQLQLVQVVGWATSADGKDTICLSDGDFTYPFLIQPATRAKIAPFCVIRMKTVSKYPFEDPFKPGVLLSVYTLQDCDVVIFDYGVVIGNPVDLRKHLFDFDTPYPLMNHWNRDHYNSDSD